MILTSSRKYMKYIFVPLAIATTLQRFSSAFVVRPQTTGMARRCSTAIAARHNLWSLEDCLKTHEKIQFIDGSWYHKGNRNGRQEFLDGPRIPGSHYFDMDDISTSKELFPDLNPKGLNVMFPPTSLFAATMDAMGIQKDAQVVVYGRRGCLFTPRIWYMFKTYGQSNVGLMQGSLEDWIGIGGPIDFTPMEEHNIWAKDLVQKAIDTDFTVPDTARSRLLDMEQVLQQVNSCRVIVDTRGSSFDKKGHIPGAKHIPYSSLVEPDNSLQLKDNKELMKILENNEIPKDEPILLSCGSGVSVCHMALVLEECGYPSPFIYDGSWNEWGSDPSTPKVQPST